MDRNKDILDYVFALQMMEPSQAIPLLQSWEYVKMEMSC